MTDGYAAEVAGGATPTDVTAWLRWRGWRQTGRLGDVASRWKSDRHTVVVPLLVEAPDFGLRWAEMLRSLSAAAGTDEAGVVLAITKSGSDITELRAVGARSIDDSMPLHDAQTLIAEAHRALLASANAAIQPRSYFGHSIPERARDYSRQVRMGQTRRGSYIIPIISRIPILAAEDADDEPLFAGDFSLPFARLAMLRFAQGLTTLGEMAYGESVPGRREMNEAVDAGVSYELCDAVAKTLRTESIDELDVSFTWAERLPAPGAPARVGIEQEAVPVIQRMSEYLKGERIVGTQTIVGYVKALLRGEDDENGKVTVRAVDNDKARDITMRLDPDSYDVAVHANNERKLVSVTGELERDPGGTPRFLSVAEVRLLEPPDPGLPIE
ncbi:hypothetical protein G5C66_10580 [Nocardioides sp. KC13]|uniref:Uncharacterized protein n=1 Tax=Nocardioides turkmenicus TaxID=2711220 RepID=A0A6M1R6E6_9ACTN|nr:hypothetical protein [Nocardioides sp. KC13]NGN93179.1 hypothetical protein [Nocardioides sp. KC13]